MAVTPLLASVEQLSTLLYKDSTRIETQDDYALMILSQASNAVRDAARQQGWVTLEDPLVDVLGTGQTEAPQTARDITLWVAARAYTNPKNLERRTAGPISETFRDSGVYGIGLTAEERERLNGVAGRTGGIWVQPLEYGDGEPLTVLVPSLSGGGFPIGQSDQFPYAAPEYQVIIDPDM